MKLSRLCTAIASIGFATVSATASAAPISGSMGMLGAADIPPNSVLVCSGPCSVGTWTGINFGALNLYTNTTGDLNTLLGASGTLSVTDPTMFSTPGVLFSAGPVSFSWASVALSGDGLSYGALFTGTMSATGYDPTAYRVAFSSQGTGVTWSAETVPVPGTLALLGLGLVGAGVLRSRRQA
jgi:hypothetical protein